MPPFIEEMLPTSRAKHASYENVVSECPWCRCECIFNRASDLGTFEPIFGRDVCCMGCGKLFRLISDSVNERHEQLLFDCYELLERKHYMNCIISATQSYEMFFGLYLRVAFLYRPFSSDWNAASLNRMNQVSEKLREKTRNCAFGHMRAIFLRQVTAPSSPVNLVEAAEIIKTLDCSSTCPKEGDLRAVRDTKVANFLINLKKTRVNILRNDVVHKIGYRPTRDEAENAVEEARSSLFPLTNCLDLHDDVNWYCGRSA